MSKLIRTGVTHHITNITKTKTGNTVWQRHNDTTISNNRAYSVLQLSPSTVKEFLSDI